MIAGMGRHGPEFARAVRNHQWEQADYGLLFPKQRVEVAGEYVVTDRKTGIVLERCRNLVPTEGLNLLLDLLTNHQAIPTLYIAAHANTTTPLATHTAASYTATFAEITSGSEGYTQAARVLWVSIAAAAAATNNNASPAVYTIITASTLAINGLGMLTVSTKGGTTGKLVSVVKFSATRNFSNTDEFDVKYSLSLTAT